MTVILNDGRMITGATLGVVGAALCINGREYIAMSEVKNIKEDKE